MVGYTGGTLPGQTSAGGYDAFVHKYDASGNEVWTRQFGTGYYDIGYGVAVDASGVYVSGYTGDALPGQTYAGGYDAFVRKYDANGTEVWTRQFGTNRDDTGFGMVVNASGVYVVGDTYGALPGQTNTGNWDAFVRKYDASGTEVWTHQFGTASEDHARAVAVAASGVYVAGFTYGTFPGKTSAGGADVFVAKLVPANRPPTASAGGSYTGAEGGVVNVSATGNDPDGDPLTYAWDLDNNGSFETPGQSVTLSAAGRDGPSSQTIAVRVSDNKGASATATTTVTINNVAPVVGSISAPLDPVRVQTNISVNATFTDAGTPDTHTAIWNWDDGSTSSGIVSEANGSGNVTGSHSYTAAGVYTLTLTVTDDDGGSALSVLQYVVVYDPAAGFVTGGGWIDSPVGAYTPNPSLTGKATFGFVSKYEKGANVPSGNTQFQFHAAGMNFKSTLYEWLVIAGRKAQYKGFGTINGTGNYRFMLTAIDGDLQGGDKKQDMFRIKIWGNDDEINGLVYDNQKGANNNTDPTTVIGGGSIVIHQ